MPETTPFSTVSKRLFELKHQIGGMEPTPTNLAEAVYALCDACESLAAVCEGFEKQTLAIIGNRGEPSQSQDMLAARVAMLADMLDYAARAMECPSAADLQAVARQCRREAEAGREDRLAAGYRATPKLRDVQARREAFVDQLAAGLDPSARKEFSDAYRRILLLSMERCGMTEYPPVRGEPDYDRASGDMVCSMCDCHYHEHPLDWRLIGYGNVPFLVVLCDGSRVKL